jgi:hypothetical protein
MLKTGVDLVEHQSFRDEVLGTTLYEALDTAYQASIADTPTAMPAALAALLPTVRMAVAYRAVHDNAPILNVTFDTNGMTNVESANRKSSTMWRTKMALTAILNKAYSHLDLCVGHLLHNDTSLPQWADSPLRASLRSGFIRDMRHVFPYIRLSGPWMLYQLHPAMRRVQTGPVRKVIGETHYNSIITKLNTGTPPNSTEQDILDQARPAMLHLALAEQAIPLSMTLDHQGAWTWNMAASGSGVSGGEKPAESTKLNAMVRSNEVLGNAYMAALYKLINPSEGDQHFQSGESGSYYFTA